MLKATETALVILLAAHLAAGLRSAGVALGAALLFLLNVG